MSRIRLPGYRPRDSREVRKPLHVELVPEAAVTRHRHDDGDEVGIEKRKLVLRAMQIERFEVRGTYGLLHGARRNDEWLSRKVHREALEFLQQAFLSGQTFDLGWVGTGFVPVEAGKPCVVKSRALRLVKDDRGTHVLSYHEALPEQLN